MAWFSNLGGLGDLSDITGAMNKLSESVMSLDTGLGLDDLLSVSKDEEEGVDVTKAKEEREADSEATPAGEEQSDSSAVNISSFLPSAFGFSSGTSEEQSEVAALPLPRQGGVASETTELLHDEKAPLSSGLDQEAYAEEEENLHDLPKEQPGVAEVGEVNREEAATVEEKADDGVEEENEEEEEGWANDDFDSLPTADVAKTGSVGAASEVLPEETETVVAAEPVHATADILATDEEATGKVATEIAGKEAGGSIEAERGGPKGWLENDGHEQSEAMAGSSEGGEQGEREEVLKSEVSHEEEEKEGGEEGEEEDAEQEGWANDLDVDVELDVEALGTELSTQGHEQNIDSVPLSESKSKTEEAPVVTLNASEQLDGHIERSREAGAAVEEAGPEVGPGIVETSSEAAAAGAGASEEEETEVGPQVGSAAAAADESTVHVLKDSAGLDEKAAEEAAAGNGEDGGGRPSVGEGGILQEKVESEKKDDISVQGDGVISQEDAQEVDGGRGKSQEDEGEADVVEATTAAVESTAGPLDEDLPAASDRYEAVVTQSSSSSSALGIESREVAAAEPAGDAAAAGEVAAADDHEGRHQERTESREVEVGGVRVLEVEAEETEEEANAADLADQAAADARAAPAPEAASGLEIVASMDTEAAGTEAAAAAAQTGAASVAEAADNQESNGDKPTEVIVAQTNGIVNEQREVEEEESAKPHVEEKDEDLVAVTDGVLEAAVRVSSEAEAQGEEGAAAVVTAGPVASSNDGDDLEVDEKERSEEEAPTAAVASAAAAAAMAVAGIFGAVAGVSLAAATEEKKEMVKAGSGASEEIAKEEAQKLKQKEAEKLQREEVLKLKQEEAEKLLQEEVQKSKQEEAEKQQQQQQQQQEEEVKKLKQDEAEKLQQQEVQKLKQEVEMLEAALKHAASQTQSKLEELSRVMLENDELRGQLAEAKAKSSNDTEMEALREEYQHRLGAAERKVYALTKERDMLRREQSRKNDTSTLLKEKDEIIKQVMAEGEELSKKQAAQEAQMKKLRTQLREVEDEKLRLTSKLQVEEARVESIKRDKAATEKALQDAVERSAAELAAQKEFYSAAMAELKEAVARAEARADVEAKADGERRLREGAEREAALMMTVEELRGALTRQEQQAAFREQMLRRDLDDLEQRCQAAESRHEELVARMPDSTRPLLRQIEAMQESANMRMEALAGVEKALTGRLQEAEAKAAMAAERERAANERLTQTLSRVAVLEAQLSCMRTEQAQSQKWLEKERSRAAEQRGEVLSAHEAVAVAEGRVKRLEEELKEAKARAKKELQEERAKREALEQDLEAERASLADYERRIRSEGRVAAEKALAAAQSQSAAMEQGRYLRRISSGSSTGSAFEDDPNAAAAAAAAAGGAGGAGGAGILTVGVGGGGLSSASSSLLPSPTFPPPLSSAFSFKAALPSATLEQLEALMRQKDGELSTYSSRIAALESTRDSLAEELVKTTTQNEQLRNEVSVLPGLRSELEALRRRHTSALELMGERDEQVEELRADLADVKEMYREQIDLLVSQIEQLGKRLAPETN